MNSNMGIDMSKTLTIKENLRKSKIVTILSSLVGAALFFVAYIITDNVWMIALAVLLVGSSIFFYFVVNSLETKYVKQIEGAEKKEKNAN
jgi:VIT1/CCC1 family predicted Fe2+/Mn2+ transporter